MSKLFALKEWLTLDAAANHLTAVLAEPVTVTDLLQLALEGRLGLAVWLPNREHVTLGCAGFIGGEELTAPEPSLLAVAQAFEQTCPEMLIGYLGDGRVIHWDEHGMGFEEGLWDLLPMSGGQNVIKQALQKSLGGGAIDLPLHEGIYLKRGDVYCRLMQSFSDESLAINLSQDELDSSNHEWCDMPNFSRLARQSQEAVALQYFPALTLPDGVQLVVRQSVLSEFIASLVTPTPSTPQKPDELSTRSRRSYMLVVAALAGEANYKLHERGIATSIAHAISRLGGALTDETVLDILKDVREHVATLK